MLWIVLKSVFALQFFVGLGLLICGLIRTEPHYVATGLMLTGLGFVLYRDCVRQARSEREGLEKFREEALKVLGRKE